MRRDRGAVGPIIRRYGRALLLLSVEQRAGRPRRGRYRGQPRNPVGPAAAEHRHRQDGFEERGIYA